MINNKQDPQDNPQHQQQSFMDQMMARIQNLLSKNEPEDKKNYIGVLWELDELKVEINKSPLTQEEKEKLHQSLQKSQEESFNNQQTTSYLEVNKGDKDDETTKKSNELLEQELDGMQQQQEPVENLFEGKKSGGRQETDDEETDSGKNMEQSFQEEDNSKYQQTSEQILNSENEVVNQQQTDERKYNDHPDEVSESQKSFFVDEGLEMNKPLNLNGIDGINIQGTNDATPSGDQSEKEDKNLLNIIVGEQQQQFQSQQQTTITGLSGLAATPGGAGITERRGSLFKVDGENLKDQSEVLKEEEKITEAEESGIDSSQNKQNLKEENSQLIENNEYPILEDGRNNNGEKSENVQVEKSEKAVLLAENSQPTYWESGKAKCIYALTTIFSAPVNMAVTSYGYITEKAAAGYNFAGENLRNGISYFSRGEEHHGQQYYQVNRLAEGEIGQSKCQKPHKDVAKQIILGSDSDEVQESVYARDVENKGLKATLDFQQESGKAATYFIETLAIQERTVNNAWYYAQSSYKKFMGWYYGEHEKSSMPLETSYSRVSLKDYVSQGALTGFHIGVSMMLVQLAETKMQSAATLFHSFVYASKKHVIDTDDFTTQAAIDVVSSGVSGFVYLGPWGSAISAGITSTKYGLEYFGYKQAAIIFDQTQGLSTLYHVGFFNNKNILHSVRELFKDGAYTKLLIGATEAQRYFYNASDYNKHGSITDTEFAEFWSVRNDIDVREKEFQEALKINPDDIAVLKLQNNRLESEVYELTSKNEALGLRLDKLQNDQEELMVMVSEMQADLIDG